jgi:flagellin
MNTHRQYTINNDNVAKSSEKLSSGYRINRAGDDAAGLAISEKMRAQVRGLDMAAKNSQDAISLVQTAEGALQEVHSMLQRMNELAVQSSTGTNESFDRSAIAAEFDQLKDEIDQISSQTTFNNMNILDGSLGSSGTAVLKDSNFDNKLVADATTNSFVVGDAIKGTATDYTVKSQTGITTSDIGTFTLEAGSLSDAGVWTSNADADTTHLRINFTSADGATKEYTVAMEDVLQGNTFLETDQTFTLDLSAAGLGTQTIVYDGAAASNTMASMAATLDGAVMTTTTGNIKESTTGTFAAAGITDVSGAETGTYSVSNSGADVTFTNTETGASITATLAQNDTELDLSDIGLGTWTFNAISATPATDAANFGAIGSFTVEGGSSSEGSGVMKIQVGALAGEQLEVSIDKMDAEGLGVETQDISTQDGASAAITATRNAINTVSDQRALLGAMQNRLEHKISNLNVSSENLSAAESRIRDVDIAAEMTNYTKNNILAQAATAMLAQANAAPQNVLSLLK